MADDKQTTTDDPISLIKEAITAAQKDSAESHADDHNSYGAGYDAGYAAGLQTALEILKGEQ